MGNIFSCVRPKNIRFQRTKQKRRKQKKSKLQKIFDDVDVRSSLQVEEVYSVLDRDGRIFEEAGMVKEVEKGNAEEVSVAEKLKKKGEEEPRVGHEAYVDEDDNTETEYSESDHQTLPSELSNDANDSGKS